MDDRLSRHRTPSRKRRDFFPALALLALMAPALALAPPRAFAQGAGADSMVLHWTAPGDDGNVGTATQYEVRRSSATITEANWSAALVVAGAPNPMPAGTRQSMVVRGLTSGVTYYFALKSTDDAGNVSAISNVLRWDWILDTAPPSAPSGVIARAQSGGVRVQWSASAEPDLAGYTVYRMTSAGGPPEKITGSLVTSTQYVDGNLPVDAGVLWYRVTASDLTGNESAYSATASVNLASATAGTWGLSPAYPNPSRLGEGVTIPVDLPASGAGSAELQIMDASGHLVRHLSLANLSGGAQSVAWDGRNWAGQIAAPGVYTAWLVGGGTARSLKIVRVP